MAKTDAPQKACVLSQNQKVCGTRSLSQPNSTATHCEPNKNLCAMCMAHIFRNLSVFRADIQCHLPIPERCPKTNGQHELVLELKPRPSQFAAEYHKPADQVLNCCSGTKPVRPMTNPSPSPDPKSLKTPPNGHLSRFFLFCATNCCRGFGSKIGFR